MVEIKASYLEEQFIKYCRYNTRSDGNSQTIPTTPGQVKLAKRVVKDLQQLGLQAWYNEKNGFATAYLPANSTKEVTALGFFAHLDTADYPAENVSPQVYPDYDGKDVVLNEQENIVLRVAEFPELKKLVGQRLITTDGTTLLGADDKAGVAALVSALKAIVEQPDILHGPIYVAFGPDEEIGQGAKYFDESQVPVEFGYTLDNGQPGDLEYETFNAASAQVEIKGTPVHPGDAYHLLVNATTLANEFVSLLPVDEAPEKSRGHQGFIMVTNQKSTPDHARLNLIIRDFDKERFETKKQLLQEITSKINARFEEKRVKLTLKHQYSNIGAEIKKKPYIAELALSAYNKLGLTPNVTPFRGGTDGNFLTEKGIPTPNLFNAGNNFHGKYEYVTVEGMQLVVQTVIEICQQHFKQSKSVKQE